MSPAQAWALYLAWINREIRSDLRRVRASMFGAAKTWDSKGKVEPSDYFPSLIPKPKDTPSPEEFDSKIERIAALFS